MKNTLKTPVHISYYAFTSDPWDMDAEGYVDSSALIDYNRNPWFIRWEGDQPVARNGYTLVCTEDKDWYAVRRRDIYTVVFPHDGLEGGYGNNCPAGGITSTWGFDIEQEIDGETVLLQNSCW